MRPTPEQSARRILGVFKDCELRAGDSLLPIIFNEPFRNPPWTGEDYRRGISTSLAKGWIKVEDGLLYLTLWGAEEIGVA